MNLAGVYCPGQQNKQKRKIMLHYEISYSLPTSPNSEKATPNNRDKVGGTFSVEYLGKIKFFPCIDSVISYVENLKLDLTPSYWSLDLYKGGEKIDYYRNRFKK
jgi:hypothetical protein